MDRASPSIVYHREALVELHGRGAKFVRCKPDKSPAESRGWQRRSTSLEHLLAHVQDGGLVGVIPPSLQCAVLDVDTGDTDKMAINWPPLAYVASRKAGRGHLWYRCLTPTTNRRWHTPFASGDTRSGRGGYVVLWESADRTLADALSRPKRGIDFEEVAQQLGLWTPETLDRVAPEAIPAPLETATLRRHMARSLRLPRGAVLATEGSRNSRMFETLMYIVGRTADLRGSTPRLAALAARLNARCNPPLPEDELAGLVRSVAAYSARWLPGRHTQRFLARQASRSRKGHQAKSAARSGRNAAIIAARSAGQSARAIAELHGITVRQVQRILRG